MKILMIAPTPFFAHRGCHVRIYEEARSLQALGHHVTIVTYHIGQDLEGLDIRRIPPLLFWYRKLEAGPSWWKFLLDALLLLKALWISHREAFDIIHAHLHEGALIGWLCSRARLKKIPLLFDYQGSLTGEILAHHFVRQHMRLYRLFHLLERAADLVADLVMCSSTQSALELQDRYGLDGVTFTVISDGVNAEAFHSCYDVASLRQELALPQNRKVVVFLGVLSEYQGVDLLLEAAKKMAANSELAHFLIMGYPNVAQYRRKAAQMGLSGHVTFTGRIPYEDAPRYLNLGDVAVAPKISKTESNAKLYNYMACGLPTVAFQSQVNQEVLGGLGAYASFGDSTDLAEKLMSLLKDSARVQRLGAELRRKAIEEHSWQDRAKEIEHCYRKLTG